MKGVLDRIEDKLAVILVEDLGKEFTVQTNELPPNSVEGTWFKIAQTDKGFTIIEIDDIETERARSKSDLLLKKLQQKKKKSKFKRRK